jgi:hypothetical protein
MADLAITVSPGVKIQDKATGAVVQLNVDWSTTSGLTSIATIEILVSDVFSLSATLLNKKIRDLVQAHVTENFGLAFVVQDKTVIFGAPNIV